MVCDTTVLLYLDRISRLRILEALLEPVCLPEPVRLEVACAGHAARHPSLVTRHPSPPTKYTPPPVPYIPARWP